MKITLFISAIITVLITSCLSVPHQQHSSFLSCKFDTSTQSTQFTYLGHYGFNASLPGEWKYLRFDNNSRDHYFSNAKQQKVLLFVGSRGTSSFNKENKEGEDFIQLFYKWDADYYQSQFPGLKTTIMDHHIGQYLITEFKDSSILATTLYGTKNGNGIRISILSMPDSDAKLKLLSTIYHNIK